MQKRFLDFVSRRVTFFRFSPRLEIGINSICTAMVTGGVSDEAMGAMPWDMDHHARGGLR